MQTKQQIGAPPRGHRGRQFPFGSQLNHSVRLCPLGVFLPKPKPEEDSQRVGVETKYRMRPAKQEYALGAGQPDGGIPRQLPARGSERQTKHRTKIPVPHLKNPASDRPQPLGAGGNGDRAAAASHRSKRSHRGAQDHHRRGTDALLQQPVCSESLRIGGQVGDLLPEKEQIRIAHRRWHG